MNAAETQSVVMLVYDGVAASDVTGPLECFGLANYVAGRLVYSIGTVSADGREIRPAGSWLGFRPTHSFKTLPMNVDTLLVPGGPMSFEIAKDRDLQKWLKARAKSARRIGSVCTGAFILAEAGITDGHRVTTHWYYTEQFAEAYPATTIAPDSLFVQSDRLWSSGGMTSGMDLALALIEADFGRPLAMEVARFMVLYLRRSPTEPQFSNYLKSQFESSPLIDRLRQWIVDDPAGDLRIPALALRAGMTVRTLLRQFKKAAGMPLGDFVHTARVRYACNLLESTDDDLKAVARDSGLGTEANLRKAFLRRLGVTPTEYRKRFLANGPAPSAPKLHLEADDMWIDRAEVKSRRNKLRKTPVASNGSHAGKRLNGRAITG